MTMHMDVYELKWLNDPHYIESLRKNPLDLDTDIVPSKNRRKQK